MWRSIREKMALYPFCRLTDTANVLIMPAIHSASISTKLLQQVGGVTMMGPLLVGLEKSVQIAPLGAKMSEIYNAAVVAAYVISGRTTWRSITSWSASGTAISFRH